MSQPGSSSASAAPALAAGVRLCGELRDTGFSERQWLIERDGRFVQLSELLYRVAERLDGRRGFDEIARELTEVTPWAVTGDLVRHIIATKLVPLGLVPNPDMPYAEVGSRAAPRGPRSPLLVNMRIGVIGPRLLDPLTGALQVLFAPPLLIPLLLAIAVAHAWLYLEQGIGQSIIAMLLQPALFVAVFLLMIAGAAWHELGHASGLRRGGGRARRIGVGLYLIYPAFFSDVTESYSLNRWGRLRTDLGGFYFHLIFAVGLIALYQLTQAEFLLFTVLIINLDMLRQLLFPFVRFDGYWILADLTGIPDFLSQMGPFVRSVLPLKAPTGAKLPRLKPWARAVFIVYTLVAVPVLAFLLYLFVTRGPRFVVVAVESWGRLAEALSTALGDGNLVDASGAAVQMLILLAPVLGLAYIAYFLTRTLASVLAAVRSRRLGRSDAVRV